MSVALAEQNTSACPNSTQTDEGMGGWRRRRKKKGRGLTFRENSERNLTFMSTLYIRFAFVPRGPIDQAIRGIGKTQYATSRQGRMFVRCDSECNDEGTYYFKIPNLCSDFDVRMVGHECGSATPDDPDYTGFSCMITENHGKPKSALGLFPNTPSQSAYFRVPLDSSLFLVSCYRIGQEVHVLIEKATFRRDESYPDYFCISRKEYHHFVALAEHTPKKVNLPPGYEMWSTAVITAVQRAFWSGENGFPSMAKVGEKTKVLHHYPDWI